MSTEKAEEVYYFPLSFSQQRLWFLDQISSGNSFYNIALAIPLKVPLHRGLLQQAINSIIQRHETLRTNFIAIHGEPFQIVRNKMELEILWQEYQPENESVRNEIITKEYSREISYRFDLEKDKLVRCKLLKFGNQDHFLILVLHHIISDGWSLRIFWEELIIVYNALASERPVVLKDLGIQYADYAVWQREWLKGRILDEQLAYWKKQLNNIQTLQLVTDKPRPPILTYEGAFHQIKIPKALSESLKSLSQKEGVTLFMTMLSAFTILLHRYTGQESISIGSPIAGRNRVELEGLIGFFVNTLVMKTEIDNQSRFIDLLQQTKQITIEAFAHQDLPFEKLVEELHLERDLSRNPLFQVTFQLLSSITMQEKDRVINDKSYEKLERGIAIFDVALNLIELPESIEGHFEYSTDLFDKDTIERMASNYKSLLIEIVSDPKKKIADLSSITKYEREQILVGFNDSDRPGSSNQPCIYLSVEKNASQYPGALAIYADNGSYTYAELNQKANQLAHFLIKNGITTESLVGVCMERSPEMIIAWLSILKAGAAYVPMDISNPLERLESIVNQTGMKVLIADKDYAGKLNVSNGTKLMLYEDLLENSCKQKITNPDVEVYKENTAYVIFTSGSTGKPKGVVVTHQGVANLCYWHIDQYSIGSTDKATQLASAAFDACIWEIWPYLVAGAALHIIDDATRLNISRLIGKIKELEISHCFLPTPLAEMLLKEPAINDSKLKALFTGGDWLKQYPPENLRFQLVNHYGPTENSVVATSAVIKHKASGFNGVPPIGRPVYNVKTYILNDYLQVVPIGAIGELFIAGESLARGYLGSPDLTAQSFIPNPFSEKKGERLYRTGDKVRYNPDGNIEFLGRKDNQVKLRGFRIELQEIESALLQFGDITEALVLLYESNPEIKQLVAFLTTHKKIKLNKQGLRQYLSEKIPQYMIPDDFVLLESFPLTTNGKIDKKNLLQSYSPVGLGTDSFTKPATPLEVVMSSIWAEILHKEQVGIHNNFFTELGGHSLLATQLIARLRTIFHIDVPLQLIFEAPTISQFTDSLTLEAINKVRMERTAQLLLSIESLSDEELDSMQITAQNSQI